MKIKHKQKRSQIARRCHVDRKSSMELKKWISHVRTLVRYVNVDWSCAVAMSQLGQKENWQPFYLIFFKYLKNQGPEFRNTFCDHFQALTLEPRLKSQIIPNAIASRLLRNPEIHRTFKSIISEDFDYTPAVAASMTHNPCVLNFILL